MSEIRDSNWMQTDSGARFGLDNIRYQVNDMILGASRVCRFAGQIRADIETYCVLEHQSHMFDIAFGEGIGNAMTLRTILAHDLPEGLIGDIVTPFKRHYGRYSEVEQKIWDSLVPILDLHQELTPYIRDLDRAICIAEKRKLLSKTLSWGWEASVRIVPDFTIRGYQPSKARREWIERWNKVSDLQIANF